MVPSWSADQKPPGCSLALLSRNVGFTRLSAFSKGHRSAPAQDCVLLRTFAFRASPSMLMFLRVVKEKDRSNASIHRSFLLRPWSLKLCPKGFEGLIDKPGVYVFLESVQDPGNVGTIVRSAESSGASGVILNRSCADLYNPKTIRATMGSIFRVPCLVTEDMEETLKHFRKSGGRIPMEGKVESLNARWRQRSFSTKPNGRDRDYGHTGMERKASKMPSLIVRLNSPSYFLTMSFIMAIPNP